MFFVTTVVSSEEDTMAAGIVFLDFNVGTWNKLFVMVGGFTGCYCG